MAVPKALSMQCAPVSGKAHITLQPVAHAPAVKHCYFMTALHLLLHCMPTTKPACGHLADILPPSGRVADACTTIHYIYIFTVFATADTYTRSDALSFALATALPSAWHNLGVVTSAAGGASWRAVIPPPMR